MIGGQLHDEGSGLTGKGLELLEHDAGDHHRSDADKEGGDGHPGGIAEDGAGEQADDGQLRAAGDEAGGHNGHLPVPVLLDGAGGQNAGHAAAGGHQQRNEALAGQPEAAEDPVHDEGDTGHIAHILQNGQQEEQHQHLGHKAEHSTHTGHNTILDQTVDPGAFHYAQGAQDRAEPAGHDPTEKGVVGPVCTEGADPDAAVHNGGPHGDGVNQIHDHREYGQGQDSVGHDLIDSVGNGEAALGRLFLHRLGDDAVYVGIALIGDDGLGVVVQLLLTVGDVCLQMGGQLAVQRQLLQHLLVPLEDLDGVPAQIPIGHLPLKGLLDVGDGVLYAAGKHMGQLPCPMGLGQ